MILRPIDDYKTNRNNLQEPERNQVDALVYDMKNVYYKIKELQIPLDNHFVYFTLNSGFVLQFIFNINDDELIIALYNGV